MDQKNRNRSLYTLLIIGWVMNAVGMSYGTVDIEADLIVVNYKKKIITASGNVAIEAADIQAQTPYIEYNYLDRKSTRLNSSHSQQSRMPSSA